MYISIYIHRWDTGTQLQWHVTNNARNDLRAWGAWGARSAPPTRGWGGAKHHPQQLVGNILMKFDVWNDIVSQISYFKSRPDLLTLGGVGGGGET